ncbi:LTA synthase family protein [Paenalcaligenes faecalis]|uniref:LTA synthase family protein n=1 Tax=Paenalcaligenes faecalis TaxID=2980099 RepID=UPI0022B9B51B|nr:LTA synthase family protein [Paenalcaligenes faecalis]
MTADGSLAALFAVGLLLSLALDYAARPRPQRGRAFSNILIHTGIWCLGFALELVLFQRPWFGLFNLLGLQLLLIIISNMKRHYLREPFFYTDTEYFFDAIKHPRLYIPFFGVLNTVLGFAAYGVAAVLAYVFEPGYSLLALGWVLLGLIGVGAALLYMARPVERADLHFIPEADLPRFGFIPYLWRYAQAEQHKPLIPPAAQPFAQSWQPPAVLPHMVMLQAESFFDPRRYYGELVRAEVLQHFDALAVSGQRGLLQVPSWGANTVRTEYAVLSGVAPALLGVHQFNPYRRLAMHQVTSVAQYLRSIGYKTICIHPYAASFYRRDKAMPMLGFDEFIDISAFSAADYFGAYVSDQALGQKVIEQLQATSSQPLFIYAITMENHGPLHWETVSTSEREALLKQVDLPKGCDDLAAYVRHIQHTDQLLAQLRSCLTTLDRPAGLCLFGDHVPIMSSVYKQLGEPERATDYLLWHSQGLQHQPSAELAAKELSIQALQAFGFKCLTNITIV